jgi:hypothetical protein
MTIITAFGVRPSGPAGIPASHHAANAAATPRKRFMAAATDASVKWGFT